jgi:signal transduction histidine kinase
VSDRAVRILGRVAWLGSIGFVVSGLALVLPHRTLTVVNVPQYLAAAFAGVTFATVGGFLVDRRPRHTIAWLFLAIGLSQAFPVFAQSGTLSIARGGRSGWMDVLAWMDTWTWEPGFVLIPTLLLQLFPTGRPLAPRWGWLTRITLLAVGLGIVGLALHPQTPGSGAGADVPLGYDSPVPTTNATDVLAGVAIVVLVGCVLASVVSITLRYRRSRGEEREQLKWFVAAGAGTVVFLTGGAFLPDSAPAAARVVTFVGVPLIPVATAVAILKYRLYDIDVVINKTVVYGALAGFITAVYVGIVAGVGALVGRSDRPSLGLSIVATAIVAVAFGPAKQRVQHLANRLVYGKRATPYEVLSEFSRRMGDAYAGEDLVPRMARILAEGTGAARARVWLRVGADLRPEAAWPAAEPVGTAVPVVDGRLPEIPEVSIALPVRHRDEMLGALTLTKPAGERLTPAEEHLARDLASQAGLVLRNVRLTEELLLRLDELQESRRRIVAAQDEERRRLERNIHDGAQQQLVALAVKVRLARQLNDRDPVQASRQLEQVEAELGQALEDLRDLARGIYPPLLEDRGLAAALRSQASKAAVPATVEADGLGRYPRDREAAVYFCCLEALQNVAKYAGARSVLVRVQEREGDLVFAVADDGAGFDPATTGYGTGLRGMADRLEALGGDLRVDSAPGRGTTVTGRIPVSTRGLERVVAATPAPEAPER